MGETVSVIDGTVRVQYGSSWVDHDVADFSEPNHGRTWSVASTGCAERIRDTIKRSNVAEKQPAGGREKRQRTKSVKQKESDEVDEMFKKKLKQTTLTGGRLPKRSRDREGRNKISYQ